MSGHKGHKTFADHVFLPPVRASLSTTYSNLYAWLCIDGDVGEGGVGSLCHSYGGVAPWLAIDYGKLVSVRRVEIFNRLGCCGNRAKNVDVRVSNNLPTTDKQMFSGGALLGHFAGPGTDGQLINVSG